ncbi:MAG: hypothetical protein ACLSHA_10745 [Neglectibacter timonensis]
MKRAGYEVKTVRGGGISFRLTGQGQERFTRLRASTLGDGYDLQDVLSAIEGKKKRPGRSERKISLAVDIQAKLAAGKGRDMNAGRRYLTLSRWPPLLPIYRTIT